MVPRLACRLRASGGQGVVVQEARLGRGELAEYRLGYQAVALLVGVHAVGTHVLPDLLLAEEGGADVYHPQVAPRRYLEDLQVVLLVPVADGVDVAVQPPQDVFTVQPFRHVVEEQLGFQLGQ